MALMAAAVFLRSGTGGCSWSKTTVFLAGLMSALGTNSKVFSSS